MKLSQVFPERPLCFHAVYTSHTAYMDSENGEKKQITLDTYQLFNLELKWVLTAYL